jgi:hypothetical protein
MWSHLALARIGDLLLLEVPIDVAALHEFACDSTHKAYDNFRALERGSGVMVRTTKVGMNDYCSIRRKTTSVPLRFSYIYK